jgi:hypothetical protein
MLLVYVHTRSQNHTTPRTQERNYGDLLERHDETIQGPQGQALLPWEEEQELARLEMHRAPGRMQWEHEALQDRTLPALLGDAESEEGEEGRKGGRVPALEGGVDDVSRAEGGGAGALGALDEGRVTLGPAALDPPIWIVPNKALSDRALCLPTFSHFLIVNKTSLSLSLSLSLSRGGRCRLRLLSISRRVPLPWVT